MKKMIRFARSIIFRPRVLLLDNFTGLDINYEKDIISVIGFKKIGTTIISFQVRITRKY